MRLAAAAAFFGLYGCNAVLGLEERGRAPEAEVVDTSVTDVTVTDTPSADTAGEDSGGAPNDARGPDANVDADALVDTDAVVDTGPPCMFSLCPGGACTDVSSDPRHCGACGKACEDSEYCVAGACRCRPGSAKCDGSPNCVAITSSRCTGCGTGCSGVAPLCDVIARTCLSVACNAGTTRCGLTGHDCVDLNTNPFHCGECGKDCNNDEVCATGNCRRYQPAAGCKTCPCAACPAGTSCCPALPGQATPICVQGDRC